ncbi:hypothetical protein GGE45_004654 [Rhizobium aethiopicum]|uniref:Uncharacterized protein n=1 Tax=Rhizobium aethiopicum TaxID=1138170 RepID=A0A7W6QBL5_9HYPH|nr:hypothetical protein [Rhizobium aethiopicum]MBB4582299.1 hypothetical protein [Rhizobium aethiopicum]PON04505.1 hypothetical protein ATY29_26565 [Rhizobium hidalgonense]
MWNLPLRSSAAICWSTRLRSGASGAFPFPLPKSRGDFLDDPIDLLVGDLHLRQPGSGRGAGKPLGRFNYQQSFAFAQLFDLGVEIGNR